MITGSFVDMNFIMEKVDSNKPTNAKYRESDVKEWIGDALRDIGSVDSYDQNIETLELIDGRALMPDNILYVIAVKDANSDNVIHKSSTLSNLGGDAMDGFYIRGRYIYAGPKLKSITIIYSCFVVDDYNNPMIPDNPYFISATISKILERLTRRLYDNGAMPRQNYLDYEQDWLYYLKAASSEAKMPSIHDMASWDSLHSIVMRRTSESHEVGYSNLAVRESVVRRDTITR